MNMNNNELIDFILGEMRNSSGTSLSIKRLISNKFGIQFEEGAYQQRQEIQSELLSQQIIEAGRDAGTYILTPKGHQVAALGNYKGWLDTQVATSQGRKRNRRADKEEARVRR